MITKRTITAHELNLPVLKPRISCHKLQKQSWGYSLVVELALGMQEASIFNPQHSPPQKKYREPVKKIKVITSTIVL
jgi:hypothetical protein